MMGNDQSRNLHPALTKSSQGVTTVARRFMERQVVGDGFRPQNELNFISDLEVTLKKTQEFHLS